MSKKTTDVLAYAMIIGWVIAFCFGKRRESYFHLNQGLVVVLFHVIWQTVTLVLAKLLGIGVGMIVYLILSMFFLAAWFEGISFAMRGRERPIPIFGKVRLLPQPVCQESSTDVWQEYEK